MTIYDYTLDACCYHDLSVNNTVIVVTTHTHAHTYAHTYAGSAHRGLVPVHSV